MINIIILIVLSIVIYIIYKFKKEYFIINDNDAEEKKQILNTFDKTSEIINFNLNELDITSPLIDAYLDEKILDKKSHNSNNNTNDLPFMRDNNLTNYNHQLKLLINSRKISQDIILNILRNKINYLMGSLKNIKDVKKKYPSLV
jgi:hypothetical protein